ncbi:hypothetical protein Tco_0579028 [Tanacetum coccineum]
MDLDLLLIQTGKGETFDDNKPCHDHLKLNAPFHNRLSSDQVDELDMAVSRDEIRRAVWNCGENKSPGPDDYTNGHLSVNEVLNCVKRKRKQAMFFKLISLKVLDDSDSVDPSLDILQALGLGRIGAANRIRVCCVLEHYPFRYLVDGCSKNAVLKTRNLSVVSSSNCVESSDRKFRGSLGQCLSVKLNGGLVSEFFHSRLNRVLLWLKWVCAFISGDGSLWCKVIESDLWLKVLISCDHQLLDLVLYLREENLERFWFRFFFALQEADLGLLFPRLFCSRMDKEIGWLIRMELLRSLASFRRDVRDGASGSSG